MSTLEQRFGQLGGSLEEAIEAEVERRASTLLAVIAREVQLQVDPVKRHQLTEKTIADDRHETLNRKLDEANAKLDGLMALLTTNGTGGRHA